ncbi:MAG: glycosyltransferase family 39 protein, partial [Anaerolineae bacterium]|nr:glycosyltransferase family 39 protein [Anaerolineae bacterium]
MKSSLNDRAAWAESGWLPLILFVVTILTRIPFASQYLYHWDSVNMAFGIEKFDVLNGAPQFPGYIVYVVLGQLMNALIGSPQTTMVLISVVCSGLAAVALYYLGRDMFNPVTGLIASVFLIASPLVWFYGEIALPHAPDLFVITWVVWMLYRIMQGDTRLLWFTAVVMALLGGFRQQDLLFLGPVALFALYRIGVRRLMIFTAVGFVFTLLWFIPLTQNAGGIQAYLAGSSGFSAAFFNSTSLLAGAGFTGLRRNLFLKLIPYTLYAWSLAIVPALIYWGVKLPVQWRVWLRSRRAWFIALWIAPTLAFYIIIHMGQQGLVFVFMPALFLLSAEASYRLLNARPNLLWASTAAVALAGTAIFLFAPEYPLGGSDLRLLTNATIRTADRLRADEIATVRASFDPTHTVLVSEGWRYTEYYLPEYELVRISVGSKYEVNEGQILDV